MNSEAISAKTQSVMAKTPPQYATGFEEWEGEAGCGGEIRGSAVFSIGRIIRRTAAGD